MRSQTCKRPIYRLFARRSRPFTSELCAPTQPARGFSRERRCGARLGMWGECHPAMLQTCIWSMVWSIMCVPIFWEVIFEEFRYEFMEILLLGFGLFMTWCSLLALRAKYRWSMFYGVPNHTRQFLLKCMSLDWGVKFRVRENNSSFLQYVLSCAKIGAVTLYRLLPLFFFSCFPC